MFSVLDRLLFQPPLGIHRATSLRRMVSRERVWDGVSFVNTIFSSPDLRALTGAVGARAQIEAYRSVEQVLDDSTARVYVGYATLGLHAMLGVRAQAGRLLSAEDFRSDSPPIALISDALWRRTFGGSRAVLGSVIHLDTLAVRVVGIEPVGFQGVDIQPIDVWLPLSLAPGGEQSSGSRDARSLRFLCRLATGTEPVSLTTDLTTSYRRVHEGDGWFDRQAQIALAPLLEARGPAAIRDQDQRGISLAIRLSIVALAVLVVSLANVTSLLLVRTVRRRGEIAIRLALGATAHQLATELLIETLMLLGFAAASAAIAGAWAGAAVRGMLLFNLRSDPGVVDHRAFLMAAALGIVLAVAASMVPITAARRRGINDTLRHQSVGEDRSGVRARMTLIVLQASLAMVLLAFAGAFLHSLRAATQANLGFEPDALITVDLGGQRLAPSMMKDLVTTLRSVPGVAAAAEASADLPPGGQVGLFAISGEPKIADDMVPSFNAVDSAYFATAGLRVIRGRGLDARDVHTTDPVVVVSEQMAGAFWPGRNPIGTCVYAMGNTGVCRRVVGVVADIRWYLNAPPPRHFFMPLAQSGFSNGHNVLLRTHGPASVATLREVERIVRGALARGGRFRVRRVADRLAPLTKPWRAAAFLFLVFGGLAMLSTAVGIYGLVRYDISQRMHELGVRIAMGAPRSHILWSATRPTLRATAAGVGGGLVAAFIVGRLISGFLFETSASDPTILASASATILGTALMASIASGWRAIRIDPAHALRGVD
jgi:predicted permease